MSLRLEASTVINAANTGLFCNIPVELLDRILASTNPQALSAFSQTTSTFRSYISNNAYLWRSLYTKYFDSPPGDKVTSIDWALEVKARTRAYLIAKSTTPSDEDCDIAAETLINVIETSTPGVSSSRTIDWLNDHIPLSKIWDNKSDSQTLAKLHVLRWYPRKDRDERVASRSYVYDMRNYRRSSLWGPFLRRRSGAQLKPNYIHVQHLMNVHLFPRDLAEHATGFESTRAMTAPPSPAEGDWAGVVGTWIFSVTWMDYADFEVYNVCAENFSLSTTNLAKWPDGTVAGDGEELDESVFQRRSFTESHAAVEFNFTIARFEDKDGRRPTIHFNGITEEDADTTEILGVVTDEGDGFIRWRVDTVGGDGDFLRRTEAVQIGGVQSASGWIGCWTCRNHGERDPIGTHWGYKIG